MNAIIGYIHLAEDESVTSEELKDYIHKIKGSSHYLLALINDVLEMSRIESGKMTLNETEVHLPELIHDLRTIIQTNIAAKQLELFGRNGKQQGMLALFQRKRLGGNRICDEQNQSHDNVVCDRHRLCIP